MISTTKTFFEGETCQSKITVQGCVCTFLNISGPYDLLGHHGLKIVIQQVAVVFQEKVIAYTNFLSCALPPFLCILASTVAILSPRQKF